MIVVAHDFFRGALVNHRTCPTALDDRIQLGSLSGGVSAGANACQPFSECDSCGHSDGLPCRLSELSREPVSFRILDVERHVSILLGRKLPRKVDSRLLHFIDSTLPRLLPGAAINSG